MEEGVRTYGGKGFSRLSFEDRRKLEACLKKGMKVKEIAQELKISRGTIFYERQRMGTKPYNAEYAQEHCEKSRAIHIRRELPLAYEKNLVVMHKKLTAMLEKKIPSSMKEDLEHCIILLESMGADPTKMKRPLSLQEKTKIIDLWKQGKTYTEIEKIVKRSRSTITNLLETNVELIKKPLEEIENEQLINKWANKKDE